MCTERNMSLELATQIASASVTATVVDRAGSIRAVQHADNAGPRTLGASEQKAFTSASAKNTTLAMMETAQKNPAAANLVCITGFLLVGGAPGGHLDEQCTMSALDKVKELLK